MFNVSHSFAQTSILSDSPTNTGVVIAPEVVKDSKLLAVKDQQDFLYADNGKYAQVKRGGFIDGGQGRDSLVLGALIDTTQEVQVYTAPCGDGWRLLTYKGKKWNEQLKKEVELIDEVVYGCESTDDVW